ncbi:MAG: single-stranded DNA-binding protein [Bacteroidia bacterium]|nr:single-stranded DNA-binding protein [Bacteroidia bacterium]MCZ2247207.1 single-stranded DNA-binding protein [Bacteroidia bacterium]
MPGINKVLLMGNLGKDPEVRHIDSGSVVASFPLATTEIYKDKNGNRQEQTEWHNIVVWGWLAEFAEKYLKKGDAVFIEGKLRTRVTEDKEKVKRYITEIKGDSINLLTRNKLASNTDSSTDKNAGETEGLHADNI